MDSGRLLLAIGMVRQARPAGFCPACRVLMKALDARQELAKPTIAALVVLAAAGVAWAAMVQQSRSMAGMAGMDMGLGPIESFAATWVVMMAAMMLPSAIPVVLEFARTAERRRGWQVATGVLAGTYLGVWLMFGVVGYALYTALRMPWPNQPVVVGLALALAGVYSVSPIKRASQTPVPRAMRAAWAASVQPDAERRCRRRALRPQLPWMHRGCPHRCSCTTPRTLGREAGQVGRLVVRLVTQRLHACPELRSGCPADRLEISRLAPHVPGF